MNDKIADDIKTELKRVRAEAVRIIYADIADDAPITVSYDNGETEQPAYALGSGMSIGDRVAVLKVGNAPGLILGIPTDTL